MKDKRRRVEKGEEEEEDEEEGLEKEEGDLTHFLDLHFGPFSPKISCG